MAVFAFLLVILGLVALCVSSIWMVVNAFRTSVLWGICVFLFWPAWLRFAWRHWDMAKIPFILTLIGTAFAYGGAQMMPADAPGTVADFVQPFQSEERVKERKKAAATLPPMFAAQKEMELKLKLTALAQKENDLRARKAAIDPQNREAANALSEEIKKYNAELQPVMLEAQQRGLLSATK